MHLLLATRPVLILCDKGRSDSGHRSCEFFALRNGEDFMHRAKGKGVRFAATPKARPLGLAVQIPGFDNPAYRGESKKWRCDWLKSSLPQ